MRNSLIKRCDFRMHDIIDGKYRVERVLDSTSTDQMFKVIESNGTEYILKLLKLWEVEPRLQQSMYTTADSEIKSCQIKSSYLTNIIKSGMVNGNPYLLTEYCRSLNLSNFIRRGNLDLIKVAKEILYGLRDLHKSGKIHCNLTPDNILVKEDGHILLTNYVILGERGKIFTNSAKSFNSRFVDKNIAYQAPEVYRLETCSTILPTVDIFSFGVILFQLLTGELPFGRFATESDLMHYQSRARNNDWNKNALLRYEQKEMWVSILESCLAADPSERAADVDELLKMIPSDAYPYVGVVGSDVEAPKNILNGIMLHIMQGQDFGQLYRLNEIMQLPKRFITIGRIDNTVFNMIQLSEHTAYISRRHCTIEFDDETNTWYLRDGQWDMEAKTKWIRSLNGTYVNSKEVTQEGCKIVPGDIISIGDIKLRVEGY